MGRRLALAASWIAASGLAILLMWPARTLLTPGAKEYFPPDFMQFWFAGKMVAAGKTAQLYHRPAYGSLMREALAEGEWNGPAPFNRPAFAAFFCLPLAWFSYRDALFLATVVNLLLLAALVWKLPQWFAMPALARPWLLAYMPFLLTVAIGQDLLLLAMLVAGSLRLASQGRDRAAGAMLAFCAVKPHLIWAVPLALAAARRWRMLAAFLGVGTALGMVSVATVGPAGVGQWFALLQAPSTDIAPWSMANVRALAIQWGPAAATVVAAAVLAGFGVALRRGTFAEKLAASLLVSAILNVHTYAQDFSLAGVGVFATSPARYLLLVPWTYLYTREDGLVWVIGALAVLVSGKAANFWSRLIKVVPAGQSEESRAVGVSGASSSD